jgi:hypothetical protein
MNKLNVSVGVDTKAYKAGWQEIVKVTVEGGKSTEKEAEKMVNLLNQKFEKMTMKQQIRQMENLAGKMEQMGLTGTKAFAGVINKAGELKAAQSDLKDLIEASRPDAPFKAMSNALQSSAQAFAGVQGAMTLFGGESEDLQKTLIKLQAAMALAEGTKAIDGLKDSFQQLGMVIKANPLIAIATAAAALVVIYASLNDVTTQNEKITQAAIGANLKEITTLKQLQGIISSTTTSEDEKNTAISTAINLAPEYLGGLEAEKYNYEKINTAISDYISLLGMRGRAEASQSLYIEGLKEIAKLEYEAKHRTGTFDPRGPAALLNKIDELKKENAEYEKQYNIISRTVSLEEARLKKLYGKTEKPTKTPASTKPTTTTKAKDPEYLTQSWDDRLQIYTDIDATQGQLVTSTGELTQGLSALSLQSDAARVAWLAYKNELADTDKQDAAAKAQADLMKSIKAVQDAAIISTISSIGEAIGGGEDFGQAFLSGLADFLKQFGQLLIAAAVAKMSLESLLKSIGGAPVAIAAGIALIAAASATKKHLQSGAKKFASGGMVNSPTFAMIGDNLNAHNNPEFVLRRDQLTKMLGNAGSFEPRLIPVIDARGISILVEEGNRQRRR